MDTDTLDKFLTSHSDQLNHLKGELDKARTDAKDAYDKLHARHIHFSVSTILIFALSLAVVMGMYIHSSNQQAAQIATSKAAYNDYKDSIDKLQKKLADSYEERLMEKQVQLDEEKKRTTNKAVADKKKQEVTQPNLTTAQVAVNLATAYGFDTLKTDDTQMSVLLGLDQAKTVTVTKIEHTQLTDDNKSLNNTITSLTKEKGSLEGDVKSCKESLTKSDTAYNELKKVKNPSKWKRVFGRVKDIAIGALVGYAIKAI